MTGATLSFCMPTYNYGRYIRAALESILTQDDGNIEVVVLDSGSTDDTRQVVESIASSWPAVRYIRRDFRGGIDRDLASSVELAGGEYCWLLSADDALQQGALRRMMDELGSGCDILLCNRIWCDASLKPVRTESWLRNGGADRVVDLAQKSEVGRYLADTRSLGALFSFMSSIVFRREAWMRARADDSLLGSHYAHVHRLFSIGRQGGRLKYIAEPLVLCRGGTDSFREGGLAERLLIDLRGFLRLSEELFRGDPALRTAFLAVLRREHPWRRWVRVGAETRDGAQWREVARLLHAAGYSEATIAAASVAGAALRFVLGNRVW
jgi:abequosyltransferase